MNFNLVKIFFFIVWLSFCSLSSYARFISTTKLQSIGKLDLLLDDVDQVVYPALYSSRPIVSMNLKNIKELNNTKSTSFKIEVFKTIDESIVFVGSFNYILNPKSSSKLISIPLPEFYNQSETYQFHVYDTSNILHSKFSYSFFADQIINNPPAKEGLIPEGLDSNISNKAIETILRNISINTLPNTTIPSIEKNRNSYLLNIPTLSKNSSDPKTNAWNQNIIRTTKDISNRVSNLSLDFTKINREFQDLKSSQSQIDALAQNLSSKLSYFSSQYSTINTLLDNKLNSDFSNFTGDLFINGKIRTNNITEKSISLNLDSSIRDGGVLLGRVSSNTIPVLRFIKTNSSATWTINLPSDLTKDAFLNNKFKVKLSWSSNNNLGQSIIWQLDSFSYNIGDNLYTPVPNSFSKLVISPKQELALVSTEFEIPTQDFKDILVLKLSRKDSFNINPNLVSIEITYPAIGLEKF